jgi:hypothetical protein
MIGNGRACGVLLVLLTAPAWAGKKPDAAPVLDQEHRTPSGSIVFRTPADWTVTSGGGSPEVTEARGDELILRLVRREGEMGLDAYHAECMLARLAGPMEAQPQVEYEYDYVEGPVGERRALDSVFTVHYDAPVEGHKDWRQRNVTVIGGGESVCVIAYTPKDVWKRSKEARALHDAVLASVRFE